MRTVRYDEARLPVLAIKLKNLKIQFDNIGYGSRMDAAKWLIASKYQEGTLDSISKKISHILKGYVRGLHPKLRAGGVWSAEESEKIALLLERWMGLYEKEIQKAKEESQKNNPIVEDVQEEF